MGLWNSYLWVDPRPESVYTLCEWDGFKDDCLEADSWMQIQTQYKSSDTKTNQYFVISRWDQKTECVWIRKCFLYSIFTEWCDWAEKNNKKVDGYWEPEVSADAKQCE